LRKGFSLRGSWKVEIWKVEMLKPFFIRSFQVCNVTAKVKGWRFDATKTFQPLPAGRQVTTLQLSNKKT
jgi:hypothetical protein